MTDLDGLEAALNQLIDQFGAEAVKREASRLCKKPRGRKKEPDFWRYRHEIEREARLWLKNVGNFNPEKSAYAISVEMAQKYPKRNTKFDSIQKRFERHFASRYESLVVMNAWQISQKEESYLRTIEIAQRLLTYPHYRNSMEIFVFLHHFAVDRYRQLLGEPPAEMTMREIEEANFEDKAGPADGQPEDASTHENVFRSLLTGARDKNPA